MSNRGTWRWIDDRRFVCSPQMHMAVDAMLLKRATQGNRAPVVRIYTWAERAVTVGKLQDITEARRSYPGAILVRRPTGGKAVLHGRDLTVAVVAPDAILTAGLARRGVLASHMAIVAGVTAALRQLGESVDMGDSTAHHRGVGDCFTVAARCDVKDAATGKKILGSAQARKSGIVLQQMSLRAGDRVDIQSDDFADSLRENMARVLKIKSWKRDVLDATEEAEAAECAAAWETYGRE